MTNPAQKSTSVQGVMKQTSKTQAERGEGLTGPNAGPQITDAGEEVRGASQPAQRPKDASAPPQPESPQPSENQRPD